VIEAKFSASVFSVTWSSEFSALLLLVLCY